MSRLTRACRALPAALLLGAASLPAQAQGDPALAARIERITSRPEFRHAIWGIEVYDADRDQVLYAVNADKLMFPGSTTKLLSAGTALATLGADHRFRTRVYRTAEIGPKGTMGGDLVLVASGDPNLSQRLRPDGTLAFEDHDHSYGGDPTTKAVPGDPLTVIKALARQVAASGMKRVLGRVKVDARLFPEGTRELGTGVVVSPVSVNDNVIDVLFTPGATVGAPVTLTTSPPTRYLSVVNTLTTSAAGTPPRLAVKDVVNPDGTVTTSIGGTFPMGTPILYSHAVPSPSRFAQSVFVDALREAGVDVQEPAVDTTLPPASTFTPDRMVAEHVSAPATEMVKVILKVSQNMHASAMPMLLGALNPGKTGFDVEREWLAREGLDLSGAQQGDGAGGDAHYTPDFMVSFLKLMRKRPDFAAFKAALPVLGKDGTLAPIQKESPAAGHVFAKTGTFAVGDPLNRNLLVTAKGLAGYATTRSGRNLILAIYVNRVAVGLGPDEVTKVVGQALGEVAAATWEVR